MVCVNKSWKPRDPKLHFCKVCTKMEVCLGLYVMSLRSEKRQDRPKHKRFRVSVSDEESSAGEQNDGSRECTKRGSGGVKRKRDSEEAEGGKQKETRASLKIMVYEKARTDLSGLDTVENRKRISLFLRKEFAETYHWKEKNKKRKVKKMADMTGGDSPENAIEVLGHDDIDLDELFKVREEETGEI